MPQKLANTATGQLTLFTAEDARRHFADKEYIDAIKTINNQVVLASRRSREVVVNVPMGAALNVKRTLVEFGSFDVNIIHDPENGSSELTIRW